MILYLHDLGWGGVKEDKGEEEWVGQAKGICGDGGLGRFVHLQDWMMMGLNSQMGLLLWGWKFELFYGLINCNRGSLNLIR